MMRDERGELRGLLILLGVVLALAAVVFGFGLRAHRSSSSPSAPAGATPTTAPTAASTSTTAAVVADPGAPAAPAPTVAPSAAGGGPAPTVAKGTPQPTSPAATAPPATNPPATSPPATNPPPTQPPATAPPTTAASYYCTIVVAPATPVRGQRVTFTVTGNPRATIQGGYKTASGAGQSFGIVSGQMPDSGSFSETQVMADDQPAGTAYVASMRLWAGGSSQPASPTCSATFTSS